MKHNTDPGLATARRVYVGLTLAYPRPFRQAYGPQMLQLFCDQYRAARAAPGRWPLARFWLRTLGDLASSVVREQADQFRSATMSQERASTVALGVLLFVLLGLAVELFNAPVARENSALMNLVGATVWFVAYLLVLGLLLNGWLAGFPRWVYPYLGYAFIFPLYLSFVSTPGLALFGIPLWGTAAWGWRAFVPLGLIMLLGLSFSRPPWSNLVQLVRQAWEDWTLVAFSLFGLLPLVVFISLDEVEHTFSFWPKLVATLLVILGAFLYMRLARWELRYLVLLACAFTAVAVMSGGTSYYWNTHDVNTTTGAVWARTAAPVNWPGVLITAVTEAGFVVGFLLVPLPTVVAFARLIFDRSRPGQISLP
jgi:hypothetical protein